MVLTKNLRGTLCHAFRFICVAYVIRSTYSIWRFLGKSEYSLIVVSTVEF